MKLKEMYFAMETCLQFYMPAIREKFLIHILGEIFFMIFSQVFQSIHGSSVGKYPYEFRKEFTLSFITFDQKLFSQWKCRRWLVKYICIKSYCFDQITKSNIIIPVIWWHFHYLNKTRSMPTTRHSFQFWRVSWFKNLKFQK